MDLKLGQKQNKPRQVLFKLLNFCQSGAVSPNLVTLLLTISYQQSSISGTLKVGSSMIDTSKGPRRLGPPWLIPQRDLEDWVFHDWYLKGTSKIGNFVGERKRLTTFSKFQPSPRLSPEKWSSKKADLQVFKMAANVVDQLGQRWWRQVGPEAYKIDQLGHFCDTIPLDFISI